MDNRPIMDQSCWTEVTRGLNVDLKSMTDVNKGVLNLCSVAKESVAFGEKKTAVTVTNHSDSLLHFKC